MYSIPVNLGGLGFVQTRLVSWVLGSSIFAVSVHFSLPFPHLQLVGSLAVPSKRKHHSLDGVTAVCCQVRIYICAFMAYYCMSSDILYSALTHELHSRPYAIFHNGCGAHSELTWSCQRFGSDDELGRKNSRSWLWFLLLSILLQKQLLGRNFVYFLLLSLTAVGVSTSNQHER
jgi:hypothetical protein